MSATWPLLVGAAMIAWGRLHLIATRQIATGHFVKPERRAGQGRRLLFVSLLLAGLAPSITTAASFDCGIARTSFEKAVCADPKLSAQDTAMARSYNTALPLLSDPGKVILRTGQKEWLNVVKILCIDSKRDGGTTACLQRQYADRLDDLGGAALSVGAFVFSRVDHYTSIGKDDGGMPWEQHTGLPRIDHPVSPVAEQWNAAIASLMAAGQADQCYGDGAPSEQFVSFKVRSATSDFVNVQMSHTERCAGGAPSRTIKNISYWLKPTLRRLKTADLFTSGSGWEKFLLDRAAQVANADRIFADSVSKHVRDPENWSFTKEGLIISFNPGEADAMASGIIELSVPWPDLHRFLAPGAPVPR